MKKRGGGKGQWEKKVEVNRKKGNRWKGIKKRGKSGKEEIWNDKKIHWKGGEIGKGGKTGTGTVFSIAFTKKSLFGFLKKNVLWICF